MRHEKLYSKTNAKIVAYIYMRRYNRVGGGEEKLDHTLCSVPIIREKTISQETCLKSKTQDG